MHLTQAGRAWYMYAARSQRRNNSPVTRLDVLRWRTNHRMAVRDAHLLRPLDCSIPTAAPTRSPRWVEPSTTTLMTVVDALI